MLKDDYKKEGLKASLCLVFMENPDYKYQSDIDDNYVIPDIMIICDRKHLKGGSYSGIPSLSPRHLAPARQWGIYLRD